MQKLYSTLIESAQTVVELGIGQSDELYNMIRGYGFEGVYIGINYAQTMQDQPKGLEYRTFDVLNADAMNSLIAEKALFDQRVVVVSYRALPHILTESRSKTYAHDRIEEAVEAFDRTNTDVYVHIGISQAAASVNPQRYEEFKRSMQNKGWQVIELRLKDLEKDALILIRETSHISGIITLINAETNVSMTLHSTGALVPSEGLRIFDIRVSYRKNPVGNFSYLVAGENMVLKTIFTYK